MFFTPTQIVTSIDNLYDIHPFLGITFLACKKGKLPVGKTTEFPLDQETEAFLKQYHRLDPTSAHFFQPFTNNKKKWVRHDYSSSGLQAINTQTFASAFIHESNSRIWGWHDNYLSALSAKLKKGKKIPALDLAVWLYREKDWPQNTSTVDIITFFINDFFITNKEKKSLFDTSAAKLPLVTFQSQKASWFELREFLPKPPDAKPDQGGTLAYLETKGLGPADHFVLEPAERLTLITGDNGLGKTFLLECAWWALTGLWAESPIFPNSKRQKHKTEITFSIEGKHSKADKKTISFDWNTLSWPQSKNRPTIPGLIVYARVDGSFAVWDPAKQIISTDEQNRTARTVFSSSEVWNGLGSQIEGLVRDWVRWQSNPAKHPFDTFINVLARLSPPDLGKLEPGEPVRIPDDSRDIPTIKYPYGDIPIVYSSAGVRRIITLAYLVVWAWNEHKIASGLAHNEPQKRIVILVDEMEAHLHPRWQRAVLPALMSVGEMLSSSLEVQFLVATHSPLVMASAEPFFNSQIDAFVHLDLNDEGIVSLREIDFPRSGDAESWLTSQAFGLKHARSSVAEIAIEEAKLIQRKKTPSAEEVSAVSQRLIKCLPSDDKFWPRWIAFAEKFGVIL